jgi:hypothetical protein
MGIIAGSFTNAPSATETTHSRLVVNHNSLSCNFQLYTLGHSPICVNEVEKSRKVGKGGTENGPAILPIVNSFEFFVW